MGCLYAPEDLQVDARRLVEGGGGHFVEGAATRIDAQARTVELGDGRRISYDVLSCNIGSSVPEDAVPVARADLWDHMVYRTKPIYKLLKARERLLELLAAGTTRVVVAGCGPAAAELSGNVWRLAHSCAVSEAPERLSVTLVCASTLLRDCPRSFRGNVAHSLVRRGIEIVYNAQVSRIDAEGVHTDGGNFFPADVVLLATGVRPPSVFRDSGLPVAEDGGLLVENTLQSIGSPRIFGAGDCAAFAPRRIARVGVHAVRQQPILHANLQRMLADPDASLKRYHPHEHYLFALNMGDGRGVAMKWGVPFKGRFAFRVKDKLDRRFIRIYQQHTERVSTHVSG
jgi:NADH dehydrogenase FAD-containing subunit